MNQMERGVKGAAESAQFMSAVLRAARVYETRVEETLDAVGLSAPKLAVLGFLVAAKEPLALSEIAEKLACVRSNVTQLVDRLEADGLVRRMTDPVDRRSIRAELTPEGRKRHRDGERLMEKLHTELAASLPRDRERSALEAAFSAITG